MSSMPDQRDEDEEFPQDDLADAKAEHAMNRAKARTSRKKIRKIKSERRTKAIARVTTKATPMTRGGLMAAGTASIFGAGAQVATGDVSTAADLLSAGVGCWALALMRR